MTAQNFGDILEKSGINDIFPQPKNITIDEIIDTMKKAPKKCLECKTRHFKGCDECQYKKELDKAFETPKESYETIECDDADYSIIPHPAVLLFGVKGRDLLNYSWIVMDLKNNKTVYRGRRKECINYCKSNDYKFDAAGIVEK